MTKIQKFRSLLLIALILLVGYLLADMSGIIGYANDVINERNGWVKAGGGYHKIITKYEWTYNYSILLDPQDQSKDFKMLKGAILKEAVDRMEYITSDVIVMEQGMDQDDLKDDLKLIAHYMGGNTVIIDAEFLRGYTETKSWSIF